MADLRRFCTRLHGLLLGEYPISGKLLMSDATWRFLPMTGFKWDSGGWNKWKLPGFFAYIWNDSVPAKTINGTKIPTEQNCWPICIDETIPYMTVRVQNWHDDGGNMVQL